MRSYAVVSFILLAFAFGYVLAHYGQFLFPSIF